MPLELAARYDDIFYPGYAYTETHFEHLATLGSLYGMDPAPNAPRRVLELGCGSGGNIISMAYQYPESEFIGIDLSKRAIERGSTTVAALGLKNIELRHYDIMQVTEDLGRFDYIIAHGVYSWVPPAVRDKMMAIFANQLSPQGIAYVSYNAHPGSHFRDLARDMMLFHVNRLDEPKQQIGQARAILKMLSEASAPNSVHGAVLRDQFARVQRMPDTLLFHDDLDRESTPFLLHQVVAHAEHYGLQYLCDAVLSRRDPSRYSENVKNILVQFPDNEFMARDQYQDFIDGHGFRRTLLCRADVFLTRGITPDCVKRFHLASSAAPSTQDFEASKAGIAEFKVEDGYILATDHLLSKAALAYLGKCWPAAVSFPVLLQKARELLIQHTDLRETSSNENIAALMRVLLDAACVGHVDLSFSPFRLTTEISERPQASLLARKQVETSELVTNLRHTAVRLEDERARRFLKLVDGTRSIDQLAEDMREAIADLPLSPDEPSVTPQSVEMHLKVLAKLALLVA